jgi:hypothetical protein
MKQTYTYRGLPGGNPLANALVVLVGVLVIAASIVLGFFAFVVLGGLFVILGAVIGLRVWWFNLRLRQQARGAEGAATRAPGGVIEGEFEVVAGSSDE